MFSLISIVDACQRYLSLLLPHSIFLQLYRYLKPAVCISFSRFLMASFNIVTRRPECRPVAHLCCPVQCKKTCFTNKCMSQLSFAAFSEVRKYEKINSFRPRTPLGELTVLSRPPSCREGLAPPSPKKPLPFWPRASALLASTDLQCHPVKIA